ncbi:MAG: NADH-quinone oxidoreductase subunit A [Nitrospira sp.]|nr:NADH-quinone oxidoreductase subunit A [Nitrospira sp.]
MTPGSYVPTQYFPILLFFMIALAFGIGSLVAGKLLRPRRPYREKLIAYESGVQPFSDARIPFPMRYYVITMLFVIFDIEAVYLYPWAVVFKDIGLYGLIEMMLFIVVLLIGFVYAWRKGALEWD